jgi:multidrug transporter EmrE-like cation transporter
MLEAKSIQSRVPFTIYNIAFVVISTFVNPFFFREKISIRKAFGIALVAFTLN